MTDQELIAVLDVRFAAVDARFGAFEARFSRVETDVRHASVQIEGLRDETRRVAESVILVDEKLERFRVATGERFDEIDGRFDDMRRLIIRS